MKEGIIEGNKSIATFMGGNCQTIPEGGLNGYKEGTVLWFSIFSDHPDPTAHLDFDWSWEWIMPVVEKIEKLGYASVIEQLYYGEHRVYFFDKNNLTERTSGLRNKSKIKATWLAVVEFIRWYSTNQSKQLK